MDVGDRIEIPLMVVSPFTGNRILPPPRPETRYFEIEVDEVLASGRKTYVFQNIFPVMAGRSPDWYFLKFRIRRGGWTITERFHGRSDSGESQWIYTDDFNILFLSSGGGHDLGMLIQLITARLDEIAASVLSGTPLASQIESQMACRDVFDSMFSEGVDGAFRDTVLYREHSHGIPGDPSGTGTLREEDICRYHGRIIAPVDMAANLNVDIARIEELDDLSWLYE